MPMIPLTVIAILSSYPYIWISSEVHHFYMDLFAVIFSGILGFYYILLALNLNDKFSLFIGIGFSVSALIDLLHAVVSFNPMEPDSFLKYFMPQSWFAGRVFLSTMILIAIAKYSFLLPDDKIKSENKKVYGKEHHTNKTQSEIHQKEIQYRIEKNLILYLMILGGLALTMAVLSLFVIFPASVLDNYSFHRPYEIPSLILFSLALFFFYKRHLYLKKDDIYKGILVFLIINIFSQIIMTYSTKSFDTAYNVAHALKDVGYFVNIIAIALSNIQNIVNLRERNELIRNQYEKIKESEKMKDEFINIAAHELRSPIQPILTLSIFLSHKNGALENYKEHIKIIIKNAKRLQNLVENVLDASRIEGRSLKLNKEQFDLVELISSVIKDYVYQEGKDDEKIKFSYKFSVDDIKEKNHKVQDVVLVEADKNKITQVLSNLLCNAVKFTKEGNIYIIVKKNYDEIIVSIEDYGKGIDREILSKIFDKFITNSTSGTGLGLYICKNIIEAHGGKIWAENNKNGIGAKFTFSLPCNLKMS